MSTATKRPAEVALQPVPDEMALPLSSVMRIIKSKLPEGVMVHKDARTAFAKACSIFILYLTSCASDLSKESKRQTVTGQDVLKALKELEFDDMVDQTEVCLLAFREAEKARSLASKAKRAKHSGDGAAGASADAGGEEAEAGEDAEPDEEEAEETGEVAGEAEESAD